jgi:acyl-coenzyme A synthetase/AMP-(fatty) acid ligase
VVQRSLGAHPRKGAADDEALDLAGSIKDRVELRVAVPLLHRHVAYVAPICLARSAPSRFVPRAAPLFHAWGFLQFNLGLLLSSTYVLERRFDPEATLAAIEEHKATSFMILPVVLKRILELDRQAR